MVEVKSIPRAQIHVPPRLRDVEEDQARAIALSIQAHGLINPVTVRRAPAKNRGATPYILIAGAHRLRAVEINGGAEIEAAIVEADQAEAQLVEITENLFRNELSALDRAIFVASYRDLWEQTHGKIARGGDRRSKDHVDPLILDHVDPISESPIEAISKAGEGGFSAHLASRMGVSVPSIKRLSRIAQSLSPAIRAAVRGTEAADNQALLLKIAKRPPAEQQAIASTMAARQLDLFTVLREIKPAPAKIDPQNAAFAALCAAWKKADAATQARFLDHVGASSTGEAAE